MHPFKEFTVYYSVHVIPSVHPFVVRHGPLITRVHLDR